MKQVETLICALNILILFIVHRHTSNATLQSNILYNAGPTVCALNQLVNPNSAKWQVLKNAKITSRLEEQAVAIYRMGWGGMT